MGNPRERWKEATPWVGLRMGRRLWIVDEEVVGNEDVSRGEVMLKVKCRVDKEMSITKVFQVDCLLLIRCQVRWLRLVV